jgi:hypothetical protein
MSDLFNQGRAEIACLGARFILIERWSDAPLIGYLGMNPSDAGEFKTDPSFTRFNGFARRWGFGGTIWANLVPYRSSSPSIARARLWAACGRGQTKNELESDLLDRNVQEITAHAHHASLWLCGWGNGGNAFIGDKPGLMLDVLGAIEQSVGVGRTIAFGVTGGDNPAPKHVLARGLHRIPDDAPVYSYDPLMMTLGERVAMPWSAP